MSHPSVGSPAAATPAEMQRLRTMPMMVRVEFGRTKLLVSDILALTPGGVVKLDRRQGDLSTLYVEDSPIAEGEVVHVSGTDQLAFRISRVFGADAVEPTR